MTKFNFTYHYSVQNNIWRRKHNYFTLLLMVWAISFWMSGQVFGQAMRTWYSNNNDPDQQNKFYGLQGKDPMAILARNDLEAGEEIPLTIETRYTGLHTLSLEKAGYEVLGKNLVLMDKATGRQMTLSQNSSYPFYANEGMVKNRFFIQSKSNHNVYTSTSNQIFKSAGFSAENLLIKTALEPEEEAMITISDVQGRQVFQKQIEANTQQLNLPAIKPGVYTIQLIKQGSVETIRCIK